jgi:hypothetical protein
VRPQELRDRQARPDEPRERDRDGRQGPAQQRARRDAEGDREQRVADRDDALPVEDGGPERVRVRRVDRS